MILVMTAGWRGGATFVTKIIALVIECCCSQTLEGMAAQSTAHGSCADRQAQREYVHVGEPRTEGLTLNCERKMSNYMPREY
jgi:hypothetical protein